MYNIVINYFKNFVKVTNFLHFYFEQGLYSNAGRSTEF
jgi:hypothetical protein